MFVGDPDIVPHSRRAVAEVDAGRHDGDNSSSCLLVSDMTDTIKAVEITDNGTFANDEVSLELNHQAIETSREVCSSDIIDLQRGIMLVDWNLSGSDLLVGWGEDCSSADSDSVQSTHIPIVSLQVETTTITSC